MSIYLLDVSVLLPLAFRNHKHHGLAWGWLERRGTAEFRTCPFTETGFVRIASNAAFTTPCVTTEEALDLLAAVRSRPAWGFWPDDLSSETAFRQTRHLLTHRLVTDSYLLALASAKGGVFATCDPGVTHLPGASRQTVELIS